MTKTFIIQLLGDSDNIETFGPYYSPQDALLAIHQSGLEMQASLPSITPLLNYEYLLVPNKKGYQLVKFVPMEPLRNIAVDAPTTT